MRRIVWLVFVLAISMIPVQAQDTQQTLETVVGRFTEPDGPAVVVQVTIPDDVWTISVGLADGERPTAPEDRFRIGSMSKTFVAVVALLLAEEGVFSLDDPARNWLPEDVIENIANADAVTIRQLLAMRSGIDDYLGTDGFWAAVQQDPAHEWTPAEALTYAYGLPPLFIPDETFAYSNSNYLLLQLILEAASGVDLHTLIRDRILDPLDLDNTYTQIHETLPGGFVNGYLDIDDDGMADDVTEINDGAGMGDGALVSNAFDLTAFYRALLHDQTLLGAASMAELLNFAADVDLGDLSGGYSLGLAVWETPWGPAWGHSGGVLGFLSIGVYLPEHETFIIVLSASFDFGPEELALALAQALFD